MATILRLTYVGNDVVDVKLQPNDSVDEKVKFYTDNPQVQRVEIFERTQDLHRTSVWMTADEIAANNADLAADLEKDS